MAKKLSGAELERTRTDFDVPKKRGRGNPRGNPNGRPPSPRPRTSSLTIRLTAEEKEKLDETAHMTHNTKTGVIVEGINAVYSKAKKK